MPTTTEQQHDELKANIATAQRLLGVGFWKLHLDSGILHWSDALYHIYGIAAEDFGHSYDAYVALVHPDDRAVMDSRFKAFTTCPDPSFTFEHRIIKCDGTVIHVRGIAERTVIEGENWLTGVAQDVTREKVTATQLQQTTRLLNMAKRTAQLGGWRLDLRSRSMNWTPQTAIIHEMPVDAVPTLEETLAFYPPESRPVIERAVQACIDFGTPFNLTAPMVTGKGNRIWVRSIGEAERDEAGAICVIQGAIQNVTDLVTAREAAEKLSAQLVSTLETMNEGFMMLNQAWQVTFANRAAENILDLPRDAMIGQPMDNLFPGSASFQNRYVNVARSEKSASFTDYYPAMAKWFEVSAHPTNEGIGVYFRDITRQRLREDQLTLLETAVSRQNDMLVITQVAPKDGSDAPKIVYVNDAFTRLTGFERDDMILEQADGADVDKSGANWLNTFKAAMIAQKHSRTEICDYTRSGDVLWLEIEVVPILDVAGDTSHWVAIGRDITDRKRAEDAMRSSDARFEMIARAVNDVVWDWDLEKNSIWWSEAIESRFGHPRSELPPGPEFWIENVHPDDKNRVVADVYAAIGGNTEIWREEYAFRCKDGRFLTVVDRGYILRNADGKAIRIIGTMMDVTEVRSLDSQLRQAQKMEAIGQLTGGVAHDFNNLLTVILGNAELLQESTQEHPALNTLAEMTAAAALRGAELTSRLLAVARKQPLEPKAVDVNSLIVGIEGLLRRTLPDDMDIKFVRGAGLWPAEVDPGQLETALLNLAINARDAMPTGGRLTIETGNAYIDDSYADAHLEVTPGQYVMISMTDSGIGMDRETLERAFEPFYTTKAVGKGSGLGLSMVYGFVKQSAGHVKIYSELGVGTTIKMYFPRGEASASTVAPIAPSQALVGGHEHILVVEDDKMVRDHVISLLGSLGYRVTCAASGPEALQVIHAVPDIDLLFTDVVMPGGMTGPQLAQATRDVRPDMRVLFTSGYTKNAIIHHGRFDRGVELLSKPYRRQELARKVRKVLDQE